MHFEIYILIALLQQVHTTTLDDIYTNESFSTEVKIKSSNFESTDAQLGDIQKTCGGDLTNLTGMFASPGYPELQYTNHYCFWRVLGSENQQVRFTWRVPDKRGNATACPSWISFTDGPDDRFIGRFCEDSTQHTQIVTFSSRLGVGMVTDNTPYRGFLGSYYLMDRVECGRRFTDDEGILKFQFDTNGYPGAAVCTWKIMVEIGRRLVLEFTLFDIEQGSNHGCVKDYLEIRRSPFSTFSLIGRFCNSNGPPKIIPIYDNTVLLKFYSNELIQHRGFSVKWNSSVAECGGHLNGVTGVISSPNYPLNLWHPINCTWIVEVNHGNSIEIRFSHIDLPRFDNGKCFDEEDYIEIRDGSTSYASLLGKYCSMDTVEIVKSTENLIRIHFIFGKHYKPYNGFEITYSAVCRRVLTGFEGAIDSLNFPDIYPADLKCKWAIDGIRNSRVHIKFRTFRLKGTDRDKKCTYDYLKVIEWEQVGDKKEKVELGKFCGSSVPPSITSKSNQVEILFHSDSFPSTTGFQLEWMQLLECGGRVLTIPSNISSPGYPKSYQDSQECAWLVHGVAGSKVQITINDLEIEKGDNCKFDGLQVFSGENQFSPILLETCGRKSSNIVTTSLEYAMFIRFYSDDTITMSGFHALVELVDIEEQCGGKFRGDSGYIYSPNYPNSYDVNRNCYWDITVDETYAVEIELMEFNLEHCTRCSCDYFAIYKVGINSEEMVYIWCDGTPPDEPIIKVTHNAIKIEFVSNEIDTGNGFRAKYSISCGALLDKEYGTISYEKEFLNCSWDISSVSGDTQVTLFFTDIQWSLSGEKCTSRLIEIMDGVYDSDQEMELTESKILYRECCGKYPYPIISTKGGLTLRVKGKHKFRAIYHTSSAACSQTLLSDNGSIFSPSFSEFNVHDIECLWVVQKLPVYTTHLSFTLHEIQESENCSNSFVKLIEGGIPGKELGTFCGNVIPNNIVSAEDVWIIFKGQIANGANVFSLKFWRTENVSSDIEIVSRNCCERLCINLKYTVTLILIAGWV